MAEAPSVPFGQSSSSCGMKREKKIIKIIDPRTGVNVIDELTGHVSSVTSAATVAVSTETEYQVTRTSGFRECLDRSQKVVMEFDMVLETDPSGPALE